MSDIFAEYNKLTKEADKLRTEYDKAEGALETVLETLQEEFDLESIEAAEEEIERLQKQQAKAERLFERSLRRYKKKWMNDGE